MYKFIEEIKKLSENVKKSVNAEEGLNTPAIRLLYSFAEIGIKTLSSGGAGSVKLHRLPADLVPLFFHYESSGEGFVISTEKKYTFFMQSAEKKVFVFGKNRNNGSGNEKMQKLLNIDYTENNAEVSFFDSTNKEINADDIVLLALRWSLN